MAASALDSTAPIWTGDTSLAGSRIQREGPATLKKTADPRIVTADVSELATAWFVNACGDELTASYGTNEIP